MFYHMSKVTRPTSKTKTIQLIKLGYDQIVSFSGVEYFRIPYEYNKNDEPVYRFKAVEDGSIVDFRIVHGYVYTVKYTGNGLAEHGKYAPMTFGLHKEYNYYSIKIIEEKQQGVVNMAPLKKGDRIRGDYIVDAISDTYLVAVDSKGNSVFVDKKGGALGVTFIQDNDPDYVFTVSTED